jgi:PBP1b-binding outer membrane lipoprotein LpoB
MNKRFYIRTHGLLFYSAVLFAFILNGCFSVKFVADYDEAVDKQVTELYRNISIYMQDLVNTPQVSAADSIARARKYNNIQLDIGTLKLRASAKDKNDEQIQQVDLLADSWESIAKLKALKATPKEFINAQSGLETSLTAILKLELAKKKP